MAETEGKSEVKPRRKRSTQREMAMRDAMADENFARDPQALRQDHAGRERSDARRDRADENKSGIEREGLGRDRERRGAAGLLAATRRIEVGPDEVAGVRPIFRFAHSLRRSRP